MDQIKLLLKPAESQEIPNHINEETLQRLSDNNLFLKELNLTMSDKLISLEKTYKDSLEEKLRSIESEKLTWLSEQT